MVIAMNERQAFDLVAGSSKLVGAEFDALKKAIRRAHATESIYLDLEAVQESLDGLVAIGRNPEGPKRNEVGIALFTHAVITYARAANSSVERFKIGIEGAYSPEQRESHDRVLTLRDKCIAHYGEGSGNWYSEKMLYVDNGTKAYLTFAHKRTHVDYWIVTVMRDLLATAIPHVTSRKNTAADRVNEEILKLKGHGAETFLSVPFDTAQFFGKDADLNERFWEDHSFSAEVSVFKS